MSEAFPYATGFVKVVNRTSQALSATYNGRTCAIPPRGFVFMSKIAALKAVEQNRVMGTEDPFRPGSYESKLYVEGWKMPSEPIDESKLNGVEALDRSQLPPDLQNVQLVDHRRRQIDVEPFRAIDTAHVFVGDQQ